MTKTSKIYVAIVDDDESLCRSLGRLLRAAGIQAVAYASAEDFLADEKHPRFDCLVLDVQLGSGMSGIELLQHLSRQKKKTPAIFITAHHTPEAREEALAAGAAGWFRKTDSGAEILAGIRRITG